MILAGGHRPAALRLDDAQVDARQRAADGAGATLAVIGVGGVHVGFGHAVALEDLLAGAPLERDMGVGEQRRAAGDEQPHMCRQLAGQARIGEQAGVEGRHPHHGRRPRHQRDQVVDVEAGQEDH